MQPAAFKIMASILFDLPKTFEMEPSEVLKFVEERMAVRR